MIKIWRNIDKKLLLFSGLIFVLGLLMVFSSSSVAAFVRYNASPSRFFLKQALFLFGGIFIFIIGIRIPSKKYKYYSWIALIILSVILFGLLIYGTAVNNTTGWIRYKSFGIQPSEFVKIVMIVWMASYYDLFKNKNDSFVHMMIPLVVGMLIAFLIVFQNDYGTAGVFLLITFGMFFLAPVSKKIKNGTLIFSGITIATLVIIFFGFLALGNSTFLSSDKVARLQFWDPCDKYQTSGNQVCNGYIAIRNSNLIGKGLGNSTQKYLYLPESHTDFIYAILIEEIGVTGCIVLFFMYIVILGRIITIGKKTHSDMNAMICYGFASLIFIHIIVNLGGLLGLIPITGIPLPFISYGGSFAWTLIVGLTMVQRINYEANIANKKVTNK